MTEHEWWKFDKVFINNLLDKPIIIDSPKSGRILICPQTFIALVDLTMSEIFREMEYGVKIENKSIVKIIAA